MKDEDIVKCEVEDCTFETSAKLYLGRHIKRIHKIKEKEDAEKQEIKEEFSELLGLKQKSVKPEPKVKDEEDIVKCEVDEENDCTNQKDI